MNAPAGPSPAAGRASSPPPAALAGAGWRRHALLGAGLLLSLGLVLLALLDWSEARALQLARQQAQAAQQLQRLAEAWPAWPGDRRLVAIVDELLYAPQPGFVRIELRDPAGRPVLARGRYERGEAGRSGRVERSLRRLHYALASVPGRVALQDSGGLLLGQVDYRLLRAGASADPALAALRRGALLQLLLSALLLAGFAALLGRRLFPSRNWRGRLEERLAPPTPAPAVDPQLLERLRPRLGRALDAVAFGLILVDREARIRYANATAETLTGWPLAVARERPVYSVFHLEDETSGLTPVERCLRDGEDQPPQLQQLRARDGERRPVEVMACLLRDDEGLVEGGALLFRDQGEVLEQQAALQRALEQTLAMLDAVDAGVLLTDLQGVVQAANRAAQRLFGYSAGEIEGMTAARLMPVPFLNTPQLRLADYAGDAVAERLPRVVAWRKDATTLPVTLQVEPLQAAAGTGFIVVLRPRPADAG